MPAAPLTIVPTIGRNRFIAEHRLPELSLIQLDRFEERGFEVLFVFVATHAEIRKMVKVLAEDLFAVAVVSPGVKASPKNFFPMSLYNQPSKGGVSPPLGASDAR